MDLRISVTDLVRSLTLLQGAVQKKHAMPILSNVFLSTSGNREKGTLTLIATDLDIGVQLTRPCEVRMEGAVTVPARSLLDIAKMLPGPDIHLKVLENSHLQIVSGRTNARLNSLPASEFPSLPSFDSTQFVELDAAIFSSMVQKTLYCTCPDENRQSLTGVFFEPQASAPDRLAMVSTDGHRLSRIESRFENCSFSHCEPVIIPKKGLVELVKFIENNQLCENASFSLGFTKNHLIAHHGPAQIFMRLIDGKFPDYNQVIPKLSDKILRASRMDLLTSLRRVSVLASDRNQDLRLSSTRDELRVSCVNPETGEVADDVPVEYSGPDISIGFNARYIIEALSSMTDNNIMVKFTDPLAPTMLTGMSEDQHLCVIMPMRIAQTA